jgi:hypothetical protein
MRHPGVGALTSWSPVATSVVGQARRARCVGVPTLVWMGERYADFDWRHSSREPKWPSRMSAYTFKGNITDGAHLPLNPGVGDAYYDQSTGFTWVWNGTGGSPISCWHRKINRVQLSHPRTHQHLPAPLHRLLPVHHSNRRRQHRRLAMPATLHQSVAAR